MHPFVKALQEHFTAHQNPEKAEPMARYKIGRAHV